MKPCIKCDNIKDLIYFPKAKENVDGHSNTCISCKKEYMKQYRIDNKEKIKEKSKEWCEINKEKIQQRNKEYKKEYYQKNKKNIVEKQKIYLEENKDIVKERCKKYRENNKDKITETKRIHKNNNKEKYKEYFKEYRISNNDDIKTYQKNYRESNKGKNKNYFEEYYKNNKVKILKYRKEYHTNNREKINEYKNEYHRKYPHIKAWRMVLRNTIIRLGQIKEGHTIDILGYSAIDLKNHLSSLFTPLMSWENYGEWHIDHIKPVSSFDKETQVNIVCSLDNLQPLWSTTREIDGVIYKGNLNKNKY